MNEGRKIIRSRHVEKTGTVWSVLGQLEAIREREMNEAGLSPEGANEMRTGLAR